MPRISAFIVVLALLAMTGAALAAGAKKDENNSYPNCYSSNCFSECSAVSVYKGCNFSCDRIKSTRPPCK
jgi:hypothetical protein